MSSLYVKPSWAIVPNDALDAIDEDEEVKYFKNAQVFMLPLDVGRTISPNATTFEEAFCLDNEKHVFTKAIVQYFLQALDQYREFHKQKTTTNDTDPIHVYLEVVTGPVQDGMAGRNKSYFTTCPDDRIFMRGVPDTTKTVGYRVWIFITENATTCNFGDKIKTLLEENEKEYKKYSTKTGGGDDGLSKYRGYTASTNDYGLSLDDNSKYKLIRNIETYANVVDMMQQMYLISLPCHRVELTSKKEWSDNIGHPAKVFAPHLYFCESPHRARVNTVQRNLYNYFVDDTHWTFPYKDHVVKLNVANQEIGRFMTKFLPDYQVKYYDTSRMDSIIGTRTRQASQQDPIDIDDMVDDGSMAQPFDIARNIRDNGIPEGVFEYDLPENEVEITPEAEAAYQEMIESTAAMTINDMYTKPCRTIDKKLLIYNSSYLQKESFEDMNSLFQLKLLNASDDPSRSAFHRLRFESAQFEYAFYNNEASDEYTFDQMREQREEIQKIMLGRYKDQCCSSSSDISIIGRSINEWFEAQYAQSQICWVGEERPLAFTNLSTFGNMIIRDLERLESAKFVSTVHSLSLMTLHGLRDAYRHKLGCLHVNFVIFGPNSTSKSFIATEIVKDTFIPRTIVEGINASKEAHNTDTDANDTIVIAEEVSLASLSNDSRRGGDDRLESDFKERLTSQTTHKQVFVEFGDGRRGERRTYSERITSYLLLSNWQQYQMSRPMQSRFFCTTVHQRERINRSIKHFINVNNRLDQSGRERQRLFQRQWRMTQYLHYHIEKMIALNILQDVTLTCFDICAPIFSQHLVDKYLIDISPRCIERMRLMTRILVISLALEYVFCSPASHHYEKDFDIEQLLEINPLLHDNQEIVFFVFSWMRDEYISKNEQVVIQCIRDHFIAGKFGESVPDTDEDEIMSCFLHENFVLANRETHVRNQGEIAFSPDFNTGPAHMKSAGQVYGQEQMFAYLAIRQSLDTLCEQISTMLQDTSDRMEKRDVKSVMNKLCLGTIKGHTYRWSSTQKLPIRNPIDSVKDLKAMRGVIKAKEGYVFIHLDLLCNGIDPVDEAIQQCYHKYHSEDRVYIDGIEIDEQLPHMFKLRTVPKNAGKNITFIDQARVKTKGTIAAFSKKREQSQIETGRVVIQKDFDLLAREERCQKLYLPEDECDEDAGITSFQAYDLYAKEEGDEPGEGPNYLLSSFQIYPNDVLPVQYKHAIVPRQQQYSRFFKTVYNL